MIVLLLDGDADVASVGTATAAHLMDLGVTSVSLLRDQSSVGLVLDGWAFDPAASGAAAAALFGAARTLRPVLHMVLTPDPVAPASSHMRTEPRESPVAGPAAGA